MARASSSSTKFASVNLNKSYGKPVAQQEGAPISRTSSGSRTRLSGGHGGMLLLSRPGRSQPAPAAAVLQKGGKLTVPLPVNLPSLRREHAGNDPNIALVGGTGASGWPKQQQQREADEAGGPAAASASSLQQVSVQGEGNAAVARSTPALSAGSTWATQTPPAGAQQQPPLNPTTAAQFVAVNGELRPSSSPQMVAARSGVYTPPRARTVPVKINAAPPPSRPVAVEKAVVLRGEDFPTLQAALPPPPPPSQQRQKELQQKQREKQQELRDQQQKLQLLSQKSPGGESWRQQPEVVPPQQQLHPSQLVSLQPKREPLPLPSRPSNLSSEDGGSSSEPRAQGPGARPGLRTEGFSPYGTPPPLVRVNHRSNWTDDEREPAQSLRPQGGAGGGQGQYSEWADRPEREFYPEESRRNGRGDDYGLGRQFSQRENASSFGTGNIMVGSGREMDMGMGREDGHDAGGSTREGTHNSGYNNLASSNTHYTREDRFGSSREPGMPARDGVPGKDGGGLTGERSSGGGYTRDHPQGMGRDGGFGREGGYGRQVSFGRDGGVGGREYGSGKDNNLTRDSFGRPGGGGGGRDFGHDRDSYSFRDGFGKDAGSREPFYRESGFGRESNFINRDGGPYGRDNRRSQGGGDYEGGRSGRYGGGDRFARVPSGRFNAGPDFLDYKAGPFASGPGILGLDSGLEFSREKRFGAPYSEDAFARDFPDLPGLEFRVSAGLGEALTSVESRLLRRKKEEAQVSAVYDLQREAFEAELERVQKLQEQERLRKLEEKERALEQARKEQEQQERLAREEIERQLRLEEEAREAVARAELEALEAARKVEDDKRAREEEKRLFLLEEDRRKDNARRKLLELDERIAKREAERKQKVEQEPHMPEEDSIMLRNSRQSQDFDVAVRMDFTVQEEERVFTSQIRAPDQDDDDRAPLRQPPWRPASPSLSRPQEEFSSRLKSPEVQSIQPPPSGRRGVDLRGGNAFEGDRSRSSFMPWRRDAPVDNAVGSSQTAMYGRDEGPEFQFGMPRERMYVSRRDYGDRDVFLGGSNTTLASEGGAGTEYPVGGRKVQQGYPERRWLADESPGSSNKRSASPRATTPDGDGALLDSPYDRDGDRHWGREKIDRQRSREGRRFSPPPPPPSYYSQQAADPMEPPSSYGRMRQSLAKQPRVPPPLRTTPLHKPPPLKPAKDLSNSSPSHLLHPPPRFGGEDIRGGPSWLKGGDGGGASESHSVFSGSSAISTMNHPSSTIEVTTWKQTEVVSMTWESPLAVADKSPVRELPRVGGPTAASLRPQRSSYAQSARGLGESQNDIMGQTVVGLERDLSSSGDDSLLPPTTPEIHAELGEEISDQEASPGTERGASIMVAVMSGKSDEEERESAEDEGEGDEDEEEYLEGAGLDNEGDLGNEGDLDAEEDVEDDDVGLNNNNEVGLEDEGDFDDELELDEDVADPDDEDDDVDNEEEHEGEEGEEYEEEQKVVGEWDDDLDADVGNEEGVEDPGAVGFNGEYRSKPLGKKEESESDLDYKDYEQSGRRLDHDDGVSILKDEYANNNDNQMEHRESTMQEEAAAGSIEEHEKNLLQQSTAQPFHQLGTPGRVASVVPVPSVQSDSNFGGPQVQQQPLSFMAFSLPQSLAPSSVTAQVPSLVASVPVLQSPQDSNSPVTLQFGLLPSSSVPAIQIGSIQMPLHLHSQSGPQSPLFQFGQLSHQTPLPSFVHPVPPVSSQSLMQSQGTSDGGTSRANGATRQEPSVTELQRQEPFAYAGDSVSSLPHAAKSSPWVSQPSQNATAGDLNAVTTTTSTDSEALPEMRNGSRSGFRPERRGRDRSSHDSLATPHSKAVQQQLGGSDGASLESSSENSLVAPASDQLSFDNNQGAETSWNRSYPGGRGRSNAVRWTGGPPGTRGRGGKSGSHGGGRGGGGAGAGGHGALDGSAAGVVPSGPAGYAVSDTSGADPAVRSSRSSRRSGFRRTEFKERVRDSTLTSAVDRGYTDSLGSGKGPGRDKHSQQQSSWLEASVGSGILSDRAGVGGGGGAGWDAVHGDSATSHYSDRKYYGDVTGQSSHSAAGGGRSVQRGGAGKVDRSGSSTDAPMKSGGRGGSGYGNLPGGLSEGVLGNYGSQELASDVSLLEQSGMEALSDEDDFIEVRSKRQMLNDRREQKEKEAKAKTKAKEQAARKQRAAMKAGFHGESGTGTGGSKSGGLGGSERRTAQSSASDATNSSTSRLNQSGIATAVASSSSVPASNTSAAAAAAAAAAHLLPPIGTPTGGSTESAFDKRSKTTTPRVNSVSSGSIGEVDVPPNSAYDNQDNVSGTTVAWGGSRSTLQVVSLTQIQLEEAMKPVRFETPVAQQLLEPVATIASVANTSASPSGPVGSLLAGEKIQFGAVTSPPIPLPSSRPLTPGLNAVVGSSLAPRGAVDVASDENDPSKSKSKRLSVAGKEVGSFTGKAKRTRGDEERGGVDAVDAEAEAEAAASAVAVAAISSDESVGSTHHSDGQNITLVGLAGPGNKNSFGKASATSLHGISMGDSNTGSGLNQGSGLEESMSVALPADLSVEPTSISIQGAASNSGGLLLPSIPGGPLPYSRLEMGTMLGGPPMFSFGSNRDPSQGSQGPPSGSVHEQGTASGGWQPQHSSGGVDSYYAGHPSSYTGPYINPATASIPNMQGPPHMLVYTNPFAQVSQFGQLGVSFMGPAQQYLPSGKPPDWKHTPVSSTSGVGISGGGAEVGGGGLGGLMPGPRIVNVTNNLQRMAPGPSVMSSPGPFDLNLSAPFQIPGGEASQWSHVPGPPIHPVPISGPLMGFAVQSRHARPPSNNMGHMPPHVMEDTSGGFNLVPASNPVSSGLFASADPAAQFPDELGLGDSSSSVTNASAPFRGQQRSSSRAPPASGGGVVPSSGGAAAAAAAAAAGGVGASSSGSKLRSGRRTQRVARTSGTSIGSGAAGGGGGAGAGAGSSSGGGVSGSGLSSAGGMVSGTMTGVGQVANGSRAPSPHLNPPAQMPPISLGPHSHANSFSDQRGGGPPPQQQQQQQGLPRVGAGGVSGGGGGWSGQARKGGGPGRAPSSERGPPGDKTFISSSSKLKQVYVVKPSSSPRRNLSGDAPPNLFTGSEAGKAAVGGH